MEKKGGLLNTIGITPEYLTGLATQTAASGVQQAIGQVWKGSGQSFFASAGQSLAGNLAGSAVNIVLNSAFKTNVPGPAGFSLDSGQNILASTITPYVTGAISAGINQQIQKSLQSAGPFGPALSSLGSGLVNQALGSITGSIFGSAVGNNATNYKMFPGGGDESKADYGGSAYTTNDIVFSLQPANQGPQSSGDAQATDSPATATTTSATQVAGSSGTATAGATPVANTAKAEKMAVGSSGETPYDKAILRFMTKGTPTTEKEIKSLSSEEYKALQDVWKANGGEPLEPLPKVGYPGSWTFITAPEDVSWDVANNATRVDIFGTNNPPVVAGSRGMRDLTLSNSLVEGFVRGVNVEAKVAALEKLMNYGLNTSDGFVSVPVYQVWASNKSYGGPEAYYLIKDIKVKETMRDLQGMTTRAFVDISLMQVPAYQVNSGKDQASATTAGAKSGLLSEVETRTAQQAQQAQARTTGTASTTAATATANQGVGTSQPRGGAGTPSSQNPARPTLDLQVLPTVNKIRAQYPGN